MPDSWFTPRVRVLAVPFVLAATLGCTRDDHAAVIGVAYSSEGRDVIRVAREAIGAAPDESRPPLEIVFDSSLPVDPADVEVQRAERLVSLAGIVAVVGHSASRGSLAAAPVYNEAHVPQVVPNSTSRLLRDAGPWTFMLAPNDSVEGAFLADFAVQRLGAKRVTVFYVNDEYGVGLTDGAETALARLGLPLVDRVPFDQWSDLGTLLDASLRRGTPDLLLVAGRSRETGILARLGQERVPGLRIVAGDGAMAIANLRRHAGPAADSIYGAVFWLPDAADSTSRAFVERYRQVVGTAPEPHAAMSYDALMVLVQGLNEVGSDPGALRRYLEELGTSRPAYQGVTGPITFQPGRRARLIMARVREGRLERVADR